jgi:glycine/D-amino acid oxidase-like deaminating enzyme
MKIDQGRLGWEPIETSHWSVTATPIPDFPLLSGRRDVDTVVVGGGYTGLSAAIHAAEAGQSVVLLEAKQPGWAASGRNASQVCPMLTGATPQSIVKALGPEAGSRLIQMVAKSGDFVFGLIDRYGIDCSPRRGGSVFVARKKKTLAAAMETGEEMAKHGAQVENLDSAGLRKWVRSDRYVGGVRYVSAGTVQPLSFARGLALAAEKLGVAIFGESSVLSVEPEGGRWRVRTAAGEVLATNILLGIGAYAENDLFKQVTATGYPVAAACMASVPLPDEGRSILPHGGPVVDLDDPAVFSPVVDSEGRLLLTVLAGGKVRTIDDVAKFADRRLRKVFPQLAPVKWERFWLGRMTVTPDHLPMIVKIGPGFYAGTGCQGLGLTYATCVGRELAKLSAGAEEDKIDVPVRPPHKAPMAGLMPGLLRSAIFPLLNRLGA